MVDENSADSTDEYFEIAAEALVEARDQVHRHRDAYMHFVDRTKDLQERLETETAKVDKLNRDYGHMVRSRDHWQMQYDHEVERQDGSWDSSPVSVAFALFVVFVFALPVGGCIESYAAKNRAVEAQVEAQVETEDDEQTVVETGEGS